MATPRFSYDGDRNAAGGDGSKFDVHHASGGLEFLPLKTGDEFVEVPRRHNQRIDRQSVSVVSGVTTLGQGYASYLSVTKPAQPDPLQAGQF